MTRISYEFDTVPVDGETMEVADGVIWLRMPLPFSLQHINLWLLRDDNGWGIVDTGVDTRTSRDVWRKTFAGAMNNEPATRVVATHLHPDHVGCANWLVNEFDIDLWMTREEYMLCRVLVADTGKPAPEDGVRFYSAAGFAPEHLDLYKANFGMFGKFVKSMPQAYRRIEDGDILEFAGSRWEVIIGRGHSPEHACLYESDRNILISGDQILPTISPNISVWPTEPYANPLQDFLDSIDRLEQRLPEDVLVLPAHGKPFRNVHARLKAMREEHIERVEKILQIAEEPLRAVDTFEALFRGAINDGNRIMATGEALAHLHYLVEIGDLSVERDKQNVAWFRNT